MTRVNRNVFKTIEEQTAEVATPCIVDKIQKLKIDFYSPHILLLTDKINRRVTKVITIRL